MANQALTVSQRLRQDDVQKRFNEVLGKRAPQFISSIISAVNSNYQLKQCQPDSIVGAAMMAATLDLPINPNLGFAYMVPYKDKGVPKAQFQIGWKGFNQLAMRSGQVISMNVAPVMISQFKSWNPITGVLEYDLENTELPEGIKEDVVIGYVAYFKLANGFEKYSYMTIEEIVVHAKRYSVAYKSGVGPWHDQKTFESMCMKTVLKLLISKFAPMTSDMELALRYDQASVKAGAVLSSNDDDDSELEYPDNPEADWEEIDTEKSDKGNDALKEKLKDKKGKKDKDTKPDKSEPENKTESFDPDTA